MLNVTINYMFNDEIKLNFQIIDENDIRLVGGNSIAR